MVNASTFNTFYDDVKVPRLGDHRRAQPRLGPHRQPAQLRAGRPGPVGGVEAVYEAVVDWAKETEPPDGGRVIDQEWVRANLARVKAGLEFLTLINWKVAALEAAGQHVNPADASSTKVFGTEFFTGAYRPADGGARPGRGAAQRSRPARVLAGRLDRAYQGALILTFGGGVNEIQRDLIAMFGLGMPRTPRM